jgi:hypothetical protein
LAASEGSSNIWECHSPPKFDLKLAYANQIIVLTAHGKAGQDIFLRRIVVFDETNQRELVLLINHLEFAASTIAAICRERWQIELFFKALKQSCKIKAFVGTSPHSEKFMCWRPPFTSSATSQDAGATLLYRLPPRPPRRS